MERRNFLKLISSVSLLSVLPVSNLGKNRIVREQFDYSLSFKNHTGSIWENSEEICILFNRLDKNKPIKVIVGRYNGKEILFVEKRGAEEIPIKNLLFEMEMPRQDLMNFGVSLQLEQPKGYLEIEYL